MSNLLTSISSTQQLEAMIELWVLSAAVTIWCTGGSALPTLKDGQLNSEALPMVSPFENWTPDSGINPDEMGFFFEGDMDVPSDYIRNGVVDEKFRWPQGVVPYKIVGDFSDKQLTKIHHAFDMYSSATNGCIQFVKRTHERDFIQIKGDLNGCHSNIGRIGGAQTVNLSTLGCFVQIGIILHELLHTLGFHHEQSRFDRNEYVTINWENIKEGGNANFKLVEEDIATGFGFPYDYSSVMHYSQCAFHREPGLHTITPVDPDAKIGQRKKLSDIDVAKLMKMYKCDKKN